MRYRNQSVLLTSSLLFACTSHAPAVSRPASPMETVQVQPQHAPTLHAPRDVRLLAGLLPAMPEPITSFGAASDGKYLYTLGGYNGVPHAYSADGQRKALARLALDGSGEWQVVSELEHGVQGLALVQHAGKLCRVGGTEARNALGTPADMHSLAEAACFDPATNGWTSLPPLPAGRSSLEAEVIGSTLYVAGGWTLQGPASSGTFAQDLLALDLNKPQAGWRAIKAPFQRRALGVAAAGTKLVMVGGIGSDGQPSRRVDLFDPTTQTFSQGPDFPADAFGVAVESVGDAVVASARDGVLYRLRSGDAAWQPVARLAFPRFFHQLVAIGQDELAVVGGIGGMHDQGRTVHVERMSLRAERARVVAWSMAYPGDAKNRQGVFVHDDYVYLFGGNNSLAQHDFEPQNFVDQTWRLHLPSLQLAELEPFPKKRQTMQTVSRDTHGIALGGFGHDGEKAVSFAEGYRFDFATERWDTSASLPESRTQFGLADHDGELWVFGGLNFDPARTGPAQFQHVRGLLHGRPEGALLAQVGVALPAERRAFAGGALGDEYFILGGMRGGFELVDDCLRFSFASQTFAPLACPAQARLSAALVPVGEKLYLAGGSVRGQDGENGLVSARELLELDPREPVFRSVIKELPFDTRHMHAIAYRGRLLLLSTHNAERRLDVAIIDVSPPL